MGKDERIARAVLDAIAQAARAAHPYEACGLLFGAAPGGAVTEWNLCANVAKEPERHFEIDPAALFAAIRAERAGGPVILGCWHSHPGGEPSPSRTDAAQAAPDGRLWLIVGEKGARAYRAVAHGAIHGRFDPVALSRLPE